MPVYCYRCSNCENYEEVMQKISDEPLKVCPKCGGQYKKIITNIGVIFKGSGFHVTDYSGSKKSTTSAAPQPSQGKSESAAGSKKDSGSAA